jgi:hypothetical protein
MSVFFADTTYNFSKFPKRRAVTLNYKEFIAFENGFFFVYYERCGFFWRKIRRQIPLMKVCRANTNWERRGLLVKIEKYF